MRKLLLSLFCILATIPGFADEFTYSYEGQTVKYSTTGPSECAIGENYTTSGDVTIPEKVTYNGTEYKVTSMEDYAFAYCSSLTSVSLPNSVTSISECAFEDCKKLKSISIPESVTSIEAYAFEGCSSLESINIPDRVTTIRKWAFTDCTNLESVTIPDSVTFIDYCAFYGCKALKSVTLSNSITSINPHTFAYCDKLESITIPDSVTSIDSGAFFDCSSATSLTLGIGLKSIMQSAFASCKNLTVVRSLAVDPPTVINNDDNLPSSECTLYVPQGSEKVYRNAFWWKEFASIQSETTSSPSISSESMSVKAENGNIIISNANGADIAIYDILGRPAIEEATIDSDIYTITLEVTGTFIVRVNHKAYFVKI